MTAECDCVTKCHIYQKKGEGVVSLRKGKEPPTTGGGVAANHPLQVEGSEHVGTMQA